VLDPSATTAAAVPMPEIIERRVRMLLPFLICPPLVADDR
jgi:hypothetical protein